MSVWRPVRMDEREAQAVKQKILCFYALEVVEQRLVIPRGGVELPRISYYGEFASFTLYKRRPQWELSATLIPFVDESMLGRLSTYLGRRVELGSLIVNGALLWVWARERAGLLIPA
jgi:hypothetical protein